MKKRRFFALFLVLGLLVSLLSVPASAFEEIDVDARAALLVEKETGEILYEKNAHEKNYPASITKLTVALRIASPSLGEKFLADLNRYKPVLTDFLRRQSPALAAWIADTGWSLEDGRILLTCPDPRWAFFARTTWTRSCRRPSMISSACAPPWR